MEIYKYYFILFKCLESSSCFYLWCFQGKGCIFCSLAPSAVREWMCFHSAHLSHVPPCASLTCLFTSERMLLSSSIQRCCAFWAVDGKNILKMHSKFWIICNIYIYSRYLEVPTITISCICITVIYRITEYRHMSNVHLCRSCNKLT